MLYPPSKKNILIIDMFTRSNTIWVIPASDTSVGSGMFLQFVHFSLWCVFFLQLSSEAVKIIIKALSWSNPETYHVWDDFFLNYQYLWFVASVIMIIVVLLFLVCVCFYNSLLVISSTVIIIATGIVVMFIVIIVIIVTIIIIITSVLLFSLREHDF